MAGSADASFLRIAARNIKSTSKRLWFATFGIKLLVAALSLTLPFTTMSPSSSATLLAALGIASFTTNFVYTYYRSKSEKLKRFAEFREGLGVSPTVPASIKEVLLLAGKRIDGVEAEAVALSTPEGLDPNYRTNAKRGPRRLAEMLHESAFFSADHASSMQKIIFIVLMLLLVSMLLAASMLTVGSPSSPTVNFRLVGIIISAILSFGLVDLMFAYARFAQACRTVYGQLEQLAPQAEEKKVEIMIVVEDYHLARDGSPVLPDQLHELRRELLNKVYAKYVTESQLTSSPVVESDQQPLSTAVVEGHQQEVTQSLDA